MGSRVGTIQAHRNRRLFASLYLCSQLRRASDAVGLDSDSEVLAPKVIQDFADPRMNQGLAAG